MIAWPAELNVGLMLCEQPFVPPGCQSLRRWTLFLVGSEACSTVRCLPARRGQEVSGAEPTATRGDPVGGSISDQGRPRQRRLGRQSGAKRRPRGKEVHGRHGEGFGLADRRSRWPHDLDLRSPFLAGDTNPDTRHTGEPATSAGHRARQSELQLGAGQLQGSDAIVERERVVEHPTREGAHGQICAQSSASRAETNRNVGARNGSSKRISKEISERRLESVSVPC